jgi:Cu/Ag efflux protein CusF
MKKLIGAVSALALMSAAGMALANEATGKIQSVDEEQMTLILDSGETFTFAEGLSIEGLEEGTEVKVAYEEQDGQLKATAIEPVEVAMVEEAEAEEAAEAAEEEPEEAAD